MAHSHAHVRRDDAADVPVARGPVAVLMAFLALSAVATVIGLVALWPDSGAVDRLQEKAQFAAPGVTFEKARVTDVQPACPTGEEGDHGAATSTCGNVEAVLTTGPERAAPRRSGCRPR